MSNWYYYDSEGEKQGPYSGGQLRAFAREGKISPGTVVEAEGKARAAREINGLEFAKTTPPAPPSVEPNPATPPSFPEKPSVSLPIEPNPFTTEPPSFTGAGEHQFGKVLASGNGKGSRVIREAWTVAIVLAVFSGILFCIILPASIRANHVYPMSTQGFTMTTQSGHEKANFLFVCGIVFVFFEILLAVLFKKSVAKTEITVYENGITGTGSGKIPLETHGFQLTYDKVSSVDVTKSSITIHASGTQYVCYVANPAEIQGVIIERQLKGAAS